MFGRFCPNDKHIGNWRIGNPCFRAVQHKTAIGFFGMGAHTCRVRAGIGLGEAETADIFAAGQLGQIFLLLLFRAESIDGVHDQRRLHRHHGAIAAINGLNLARHQTVRDIRRARPAIFRLNGDTQQALRAHFGENFRRVRFIDEHIGDARQQIFPRIGARAIGNHALFFRQLLAEQKRVFSIKLCNFFHAATISHSPKAEKEKTRMHHNGAYGLFPLQKGFTS